MKIWSLDEYISEIKYSYKNSRWEFSFYAVMYSFLCQFRNEKIKLVYCADWKSRGKKTSELMKKNLKYCSVKFIDNNDKEKIGGIPDFQFVPSSFSYETPCEAYVFVEFKSPEFSNENENEYIPLKYCKTSEIEHEFENCNRIIFTDGITWYFIENKKQMDAPEKPIVLVDNLNPNINAWNILNDRIINFINPTCS